MASQSDAHFSRISFTAVIITCNVDQSIGPCLAALKKVASQIIVLDSFSTDNTVRICEDAGVQLLNQEWFGYSATKNLGNKMASNDWILSIDADEVLSDELIASLNNLEPKRGEVYMLDRLTSFNGKWIYHSGWYPDWKPRLFHRDEVQWQGDYVHETLKIPPGFRRVKLKGKLFHFSYRDANDHFSRIEKYARLSAMELFAQGHRSTLFNKWVSPNWRFVRTYFFKLGFLDGKNGFLISLRNVKMIKRRYHILDALWREKES
jgi:glycosyltransferase involved in cell wall biosynthesis